MCWFCLSAMGPILFQILNCCSAFSCFHCRLFGHCLSRLWCFVWTFIGCVLINVCLWFDRSKVQLVLKLTVGMCILIQVLPVGSQVGCDPTLMSHGELPACTYTVMLWLVIQCGVMWAVIQLWCLVGSNLWSSGASCGCDPTLVSHGE